MRGFEYPRRTLIELIEANRAKHAAIVAEAQAGYRAAVTAKLRYALSETEAGRKTMGVIYIKPPVDHTSDYDSILRQLQLAVQDTVELSSQDFDRFVLDRWAWRGDFLSTNSAYSATAAEAVDADDVGEV